MDIKNFSIMQIKELIANTSITEYMDLINIINMDQRKGVRKLAEGMIKKLKIEEELNKKSEFLIRYENDLWKEGYEFVGGIDEVGRGPLAGPVVAACVILPKYEKIMGIDDSKKLSSEKREYLYNEINKKAIAIGIGRVCSKRIDGINILNATYEAMAIAIKKCSVRPDYLLIDALTLEKCTINQKQIIKGDANSQTIAAASIIAKVTRDREMEQWEKVFPGYGFKRHKGYGTQEHIEAINKSGLSPIHRKSFTSKFHVECYK